MKEFISHVWCHKRHLFVVTILSNLSISAVPKVYTVVTWNVVKNKWRRRKVLLFFLLRHLH